MVAISQGRTEIIEEFESMYKDVFLKTLDLITYYTGIRANVDFGEFKYFSIQDPSDPFKIASKVTGNYSKGKKARVSTKFIATLRQYEDPIFRSYSMAAAHEAGELAYLLVCQNMDRLYYKSLGEIIGEFFFRLFCKRSYGKRKIPTEGYEGVYRVAAKFLDRLEKLTFEEQIWGIRKLMFGRI